MDFLSDVDIYPKIIVGLTGVIALFVKLRDEFSAYRNKQEIKLDLDIYELLKRNQEVSSTGVKEKIESKIVDAFENKESRLTNFLIGLVVFVGFGLWSVEIYQTSTGFNGWIILTLFTSFIGLSMVLGFQSSNDSKEVFFQIGLFDRSNFLFSLFTIFITGILTPILIIKAGGFSWWVFLSGLFFLIGVNALFKNVRRIK